MFFNKKGQSGTIAKVVAGAFALFIIVLAIITLTNLDQGVGPAIKLAFNEVSNFFVNFPGNQFFGFILGLNDQNSNNQFLMILAFILMSIIIIGTLDSANIFGGTDQGGLINFAIGIIVSIIGVRFMPNDIWGSLTAPSSALVATFFVGAPFIALFFITMKIKYHLANKLLWLFYIIFMSYLIFFPSSGASLRNAFMWVYVSFLILAGIMMFFDSTVRRVFYREMRSAEAENFLEMMGPLERKVLRDKIEKWYGVLNDSSSSPTDQVIAQGQINKLKKKYKNLDLESV